MAHVSACERAGVVKLAPERADNLGSHHVGVVLDLHTSL